MGNKVQDFIIHLATEGQFAHLTMKDIVDIAFTMDRVYEDGYLRGQADANEIKEPAEICQCEECIDELPTIVVVETENQQKYFKEHAERNNLPFHVIVKGQSIRGFNYRGYRANTVIMVCNIVTDKEWEWVKEELIPTLDKDYSLLR